MKPSRSPRLSLLMSVIGFMAMSLIILSACSDPVKPENLEPGIDISPATDITRTEAVLSARVIKRGTVGLRHIAFYYGMKGGPVREIPVSDVTSEYLTLHLEGLKPGTSYYWYVEGGTSTATIRSDSSFFSTFPNDPPTVSSPVPLSTGPLGIIVSFDIVDDGGEPILEAGCIVTEQASQSIRRVNLPTDCLKQGTQTLHIVGLSVRTGYTITPFAANSSGEARGKSLEYTTSDGIVLKDSGSLAGLFDSEEAITLEKFTISGPMNGDDFRFLRLVLGAPLLPGEAPVESSVTEVELTDVSITPGGGPYDGNRYTVADEISTDLFSDCTRLERIQLPATATVLARDAIARCHALRRLILPPYVVNILPSEECTALAEIEVSPANEHFTSIDGVLFNKEANSILWFPLGKTGSYVLPSTITSIGENAFAGTAITSLAIPSSVTTISRGAFAGSSLREISLPDNLKNVSESMFQDCTSLTTVRLGKSTEFIGNYVFDGTSLSSLYVSAVIPPYTSEYAFSNRGSEITGNCTLYVPEGRQQIYRNHPRWGKFSNIIGFQTQNQ